MLKTWLPWGLKVTLTGLLMWFLLKDIDVDRTWSELRRVAPTAVVLALLLALAQTVIGAWRWRVVLQALGAPLPALKMIEIMLIASFFNQVLPGAVGGDAVRMWRGRRAGLELNQAVTSVMLERVGTVLALLLLVAATEPLLWNRIDDTATLVAFPILAAVGVAGTALLMVLDRVPAGLRRWRMVRGLAHLAADARYLFLRPGRAGAMMALAVVGHLNLALVVYVLAMGLGLDVGFIDCMVLVPPVILVMTLPISIAGWGVREQAMVTAFGFIGVPSESTLALSVLFGLVVMASGVPGGVVWLAAGGRKASGRIAGAAPDAVQVGVGGRTTEDGGP